MHFVKGYTRHSQPADTSSRDLTDKRPSVGKRTKMTHILSSGDLILELLKCQVLICCFVHGLLNWSKNGIRLQLCLSILANYQFFYLLNCVEKIPSDVLGNMCLFKKQLGRNLFLVFTQSSINECV
jgi:hypothetical protein